MFIAAYLVNDEWVNAFRTNKPTKELERMRKEAREITGCTLCGILNPSTKELMCYSRP